MALGGSLLLLGGLLRPGESLMLDGVLLSEGPLELGESMGVDGSFELDEALETNELLARDESLELGLLEVMFVLSLVISASDL
jgi:hypothetical protein